MALNSYQISLLILGYFFCAVHLSFWDVVVYASKALPRVQYLVLIRESYYKILHI